MAAVMEVTFDWEGVKARPDNRVDVLIEAALGAPVKRSSHNLEWHCPFHHDPNPSFKVDLATNKWRCWGGCFGDQSHDAFDWMHAYYGMDRVEAYKYLAGESLDGPPRPAVDLSALPPVPKKKAKRSVEWDEIERITAGPSALAYFAGRGITEETVREYHLGDEMRRFAVVAEDPDNPIGWTDRHHYTIPYIQPDETILTVKCRRDDAYVRKALVELKDPLFGRGLEYLNDTYGPEKVTQRVMEDFFFGGKFTYWGGRQTGVVYNSRVLRHVLPNGNTYQPWLPYILVPEAEIDVLYLRDARGKVGWPAVAVKVPSQLDLTLFAHAHRIYIIRDNDPDKTNERTGEVTNPGQNIAASLKKRLPEATILVPPAHRADGQAVKDVNDLPPKELEAWLRANGIHPLPRALL